VSRAISLDPYWVILPLAQGWRKNKTSIHSTEVHCTAYQYTIALTPESLKSQNGQFSHLMQFLPFATLAATIPIPVRLSTGINRHRVTADPSPWIMGCFERVGDSIGCPRLVRLVEVKMSASELIVAGEIAYTPYGKQLKQGVKVCRGVKKPLLQRNSLMRGYYLMLLYLNVPALASPQFARDYKETYRYLPPATVYGFIIASG